MHGFGRQPRCGQRWDSARTFRSALARSDRRPGTNRARLGSTSTTNAFAAWTYIGKPSRNGSAGSMPAISSSVPTRTFGCAPPTAFQRKLDRAGADLGEPQRRAPSPSERRSSVRRLMPSTGSSRSARRRAATRRRLLVGGAGARSSSTIDSPSARSDAARASWRYIDTRYTPRGAASRPDPARQAARSALATIPARWPRPASGIAPRSCPSAAASGAPRSLALPRRPADASRSCSRSCATPSGASRRSRCGSRSGRAALAASRS